MTIMEKQAAARENLVKYLKDVNIVMNWDNREIIIENNGETKEQYPYLILHVSAVTKEFGENQIIELNEKIECFNNKKRARFIDRLMKGI